MTRPSCSIAACTTALRTSASRLLRRAASATSFACSASATARFIHVKRLITASELRQRQRDGLAVHRGRFGVVHGGGELERARAVANRAVRRRSEQPRERRCGRRALGESLVGLVQQGDRLTESVSCSASRIDEAHERLLIVRVRRICDFVST